MAARGRSGDLDRVWGLLPVLVPFLVTLTATMGAVDLAYQIRAGDGILATGRAPAVRHVRVHDVGRPLAGPAVGRPGDAGAHASRRGVGGPGGAQGRADRDDLRPRVPRLPCPGSRPPHVVPPDVRRHRARAARARPAPAALRVPAPDGVALGARRAPRPPPADLVAAGVRDRAGEPARRLRARAGVRGPRPPRGPDRSRSGRAADPVGRPRGDGRHAREPVRRRRLAVRPSGSPRTR